MKSRLRCVGVLLLLVTAAAHAGVDIELDIDGGTAQMQNNVRAFISLSRYESRTDLTPEIMDRLTARIPSEVGKALEPLGYYEPEVSYEASVKPGRNDDQEWRVAIRINPGRAVRLSEVNILIDGAGKDDARITEARNNEELRPGKRLDHGVYDTAKAALMRAATSSGYLDAKWVQSDLLIDKAERRAYVTLQLDTGERYAFGAINIEQEVIRDDKMQRLLRMRTGEPYDLDLILQTQYVLDDTQYFSGAEVQTGTPDPLTHTVPINIKAPANRKNSYAIAAGYGTDTQARGTLTWDRRLVNRAGHRAKVELTGSGTGYEATARYIIPVRDIALEKVEFIVSNTKEELADAISYRNEFTTSFTQVLGSWQRVLFTRVSREKSVLPDSEETTSLIIPGISYATMPNYILGQKVRRYSFYGEVSGSPSSLGSGASFVQLLLQGERIFDLSDVWHLRVRGTVGASWLPNTAFKDLPVSARFFAGGDNSVRGFGLNELSPVDAEGNRVGARNLLVGTAEIERDLPKNLRLAVFYDIGNAIDHFGDELEDSAGVGLRWHMSVASLGLDVAQPLSEPGRKPRLHLHLSTLF